MTNIDFKDILEEDEPIKQPKKKNKPLIKEKSTIQDIKEEIIPSPKPSKSKILAQNLINEIEVEEKTKIKPKEKPKQDTSDQEIIILESSAIRFKKCPLCASKVKRSKVIKINNTLFQKFECKKCDWEITYKFDIE
jgi:predicted RNA-binding Zn-ribbon protein involved in translation (DUF1610 family)